MNDSPSNREYEATSEVLLNRTDAAIRLGVSARTLDRWNLLRYGPPRLKLGRKVWYRSASIEAWILSQEIDHSKAITGSTGGR